MLKSLLSLATLIIISLTLSLNSCTEKEDPDDTPKKGSLKGYVYNAISKKPLDQVKVKMGKKSLQTSYIGEFNFGVTEAGTYTVTVSKAGYVTQTKDVTVLVNEESVMEFFLETDAPYLKISSNSKSIDSTAQNLSINIESNFNWIIEDYSTWIECYPTSGIGDKVVNIKCKENTTGKNRTDSVVVKCDKLTETLTIIQSK